MAVDAEEVQELGRQGVAEVRRWLEATTFMELHWNVYEMPSMCVATHAAGRKKFDLAGSFIGATKQPVFVECKKYKSSNGQHKEFREFLAIAYSSTQRSIHERGGDTGTEFIWVTFAPFQITEWSKLESHEKIEASLKEFPAYLDGKPLDQDLIRLISERVWVLVLNKKQERVTLTHRELMMILPTLERKKPTL